MSHTFDLDALGDLAPLDRVRRCNELLVETNRLRAAIGVVRQKALVAARAEMSVADIADELGTSQAAVYKSLGRQVDPDLVLLRELIDFAADHYDAMTPRDVRQLAAMRAGGGNMQASALRICALASANRSGNWVHDLQKEDPDRWQWYTSCLERIHAIAHPEE